MELLMNGFEAAAVNMGVKLGRGNIGVAKHQLDRPQVGAVL